MLTDSSKIWAIKHTRWIQAINNRRAFACTTKGYLGRNVSISIRLVASHSNASYRNAAAGEGRMDKNAQSPARMLI